ncbi:MAG: zinc ribbon domain-containing protein [Blastocatellia bacterium]|nr:zinc ribbon domain-containing protein [Blastocatellia bacterium]
MFCPSCGKNFIEERNFCSNCGTNLHTVRQAVHSTNLPPPSPVQVPTEMINSLLPESNHRKFRRLAFMVSAIGFLLTVITSIVGSAITDIIPFFEPIFAAATSLCGVAFVFGGPMVWLYGRLIYKKEELPRVVYLQVPNNLETLGTNVNQQPRPLFSSPTGPFGENFANSPVGNESTTLKMPNSYNRNQF